MVCQSTSSFHMRPTIPYYRLTEESPPPHTTDRRKYIPEAVNEKVVVPVMSACPDFCTRVPRARFTQDGSQNWVDFAENRFGEY